MQPPNTPALTGNGTYACGVGEGCPWPVATRATVPHMIDLTTWGFGKMNMDNP